MMRKALLAVLCIFIVSYFGSAEARFAGYGIGAAVTPSVKYLTPADQSTVDLTGKESMVFTWNPVPVPAGGVQNYRFRLYKGFDYGSIFANDLEPRTWSIEVPSNIFEDGQTYTWRVQQRDAQTMNWSRYDTWSFKVIKR